MNLNLLHYNNYYNRQIKIEDSLTDYQPYIFSTLTDVNYFPDDGVNTQIIVNRITEIPDYVIYSDKDGNIVSRWFVIDSNVKSGLTQFNLLLRRDLVADNFEEVKDAPMFVEKAILNADDPMIFKSD